MEYRKEQNMEYRIWNIEYWIRIFQHSTAPGANLLIRQLQHSDQSGVATLPTVLLLGAMALVVAVSITALSLTELFISQGSAQSSRAHFYAESGARDALIKIARDKNYAYTTGEGYGIDFGTNGCALLNDCAKVLVVGDAVTKTITSKGIMKSSTRTLKVAVTLDSNGAITDATWSEVVN